MARKFDTGGENQHREGEQVLKNIEDVLGPMLSAVGLILCQQSWDGTHAMRCARAFVKRWLEPYV